jgi:predicted ATPase
LGSFFVRLVKELKAEFVIETHSDYLLDRIRREITEGKITASDVLFLYLSKKGAKSKVYPIEIDSLGNIQGAPRDYRRFFLEEEERLMMRSAR